MTRRIRLPNRDDAAESLDAARQHVADALYAIERCQRFRGHADAREAVERASTLLAASAVLVRTATERRRVSA